MLNVVAFCFTDISFNVSNMQNFSLILAVPYQIFTFFKIFIDNKKMKRKEQTISINIAFNYCSEKFKMKNINHSSFYRFFVFSLLRIGLRKWISRT